MFTHVSKTSALKSLSENLETQIYTFLANDKKLPVPQAKKCIADAKDYLPFALPQRGIYTTPNDGDKNRALFFLKKLKELNASGTSESGIARNAFDIASSYYELPVGLGISQELRKTILEILCQYFGISSKLITEKSKEQVFDGGESMVARGKTDALITLLQEKFAAEGTEMQPACNLKFT